MMRPAVPPGVASWLIKVLVPASDRGELLGDLHERFLDRCDAIGPRRARAWYWRQSALLAPRLLADTVATV